MLGVVMAGGEARRLGADKATVLIGGEPLWQRQLGVLRAAGAERTVLIRRAGQFSLADVECWNDPVTGAGPLGGLYAALLPRVADHVAVLAVDMPGITAGWFRWLVGFCRPGVGAMVRHAEACEPLAAIYPAEALAEVGLRLKRGDYSLQRLALALAVAGRMTLMAPPESGMAKLRSVNLPEDLAYWASRSANAGHLPGGPEQCAGFGLPDTLVFPIEPLPANNPLPP